MSARKGVPVLPHTDPVLNVLICAYRQAFNQAEGDGDDAQRARAEIVNFFSIEKLMLLYTQGMISWNPLAVNGIRMC